MRAIVNEGAVLNALQSFPVVKGVFEVEMPGMKEARYLACSLDGMLLLELQIFNRDVLEDNNVIQVDGIMYALSTLEMKTRVATSFLGDLMLLSTGDIICSDVRDADFRKYIPSEHRGQLVYQMMDLKISFVINSKPR
ncbi:hypothetical protein BWQ96_07841 [Gracilariopsis chorda]|uniref:Uncharacterized protein n=1 Tax=Gracilariopsis chorda TaxID=448386 RepID=A0A2V3IMU0_9FLOR|nr:hypothetical protein BWQ96_07841 [Gracilariopsis chorda]|eukprot:PXF42430.1 hypothetical protein BWQ96_07841 [Gracilariopsis chorda]